MSDSHRLLPVIPFALAAFTAFAGCGQAATATVPLPSYGNPSCDRYGQIDLGDQYMIQNNRFNDVAANQSQCVNALWDGAGKRAGFVVSPVGIDVPGPGSGSYPSLVLGWHWGPFYGAYTSARTIDSLKSVRSTWSFAAPAEGSYNVSYDMWLHPDEAPGYPTDGLELMVWIATRDATPIGEMMAVATIEGTDWEVWAGPNADWTAVTYRRAENATGIEDLDLLPFIDDAVARGHGGRDWRLLAVEAGFEIWRAADAFESRSYVVEIR